MLLKLKCRRFKKINNWKKIFYDLKSNSKSKSKFRYPNNEISNDEFQILHCLKTPKKGNFKPMDFKSMNFKSKSKSKYSHPNTTYKKF